MSEPTAPGAPGATPPVPNAAETELQSIISGNHEKSAAGKNSDRATLDYVTNLRKVAAGEPGEQKPIEKPAEQAPVEADGEPTEAELEAFKSEIEAEKSMCMEELEHRWGEKDSPTFQANAKSMAEVRYFLFNENDDGERDFRDAFEGEFGRSPDIIDEILQLKPRLGDVLNRPPAKVSFENLTPEAADQIAEKARLYLRENLEGTLLIKKLEAFSREVNPGIYGNWLLRIGQALFTGFRPAKISIWTQGIGKGLKRSWRAAQTLNGAFSTDSPAQ